MKTNEFLQTVYASLYLSDKIKLNEIILQIDTVRKLHIRLQQKLEYMLCDPMMYESQEERKKIKSIALEIKDFCKEYHILVSFFKIPNEYIEFSKLFRENKIFATYWYNKIQITSLIVFHDEKTKKKQLNKKVEEIKEIIFDPNEENHNVFDDNGKDLNKVEGYDL